MKRLRIAMLAHSTLPRGGVVHAIELSEALQALGHRVTLHAPDADGRGFQRRLRCAAVPVRAAPLTVNAARSARAAIAGTAETAGTAARANGGGVAELVRQRATDYLAHFERAGVAGYDIWHAQDPISANALATLVEQGRIGGFVRTVHHLDRFDDPQLMALQQRGHRSAALVLCVSRQWRDILAREHGIDAEQVANGVDRHRYRPLASMHGSGHGSTHGSAHGFSQASAHESANRSAHDAAKASANAFVDASAKDGALAARLGLRGGPVLLAVGGIEARKNTLRILQAFIALRADSPRAQLVLAGGASLLDHSAYRAEFHTALAASGLRVALGEAGREAQADVVVTGPLPDADMPSLYRCADALLFPSLCEGFGLVVLEALACGTPVVVSRIAPFTEHLHDGVVGWCDPLDVASIAQAARRVLQPEVAAPMRAAAEPLLARYGWAASAARHVALYERFLAAGAGAGADADADAALSARAHAALIDDDAATNVATAANIDVDVDVDADADLIAHAAAAVARPAALRGPGAPSTVSPNPPERPHA